MIVGKLLDNRYRILQKIGEGGMAKVYKASDTVLNRFVTVKVLRDQLTGDLGFVRRFHREAQAAASLSHPHIVNIFDVGCDNDIHYIVMEYVDGYTLKELIIQQGRIPEERAIKITRQICEALVHAHQHGVIHRDIKPQNILMTRSGIVKVTDFGIARAASVSTVTHDNTAMGTVFYFSPEQARGSHAGEHSDIYSLGIVLYEMLTGDLPFSGDSPISIALKHLQEEITPPRRLNEEIDEQTEAMIMKAVRKDPAERYPSAQAFLDDIIQWQETGTVKANLIAQDDNALTKEITPVKEEKVAEMNKRKKKKRSFGSGWIVLILLILTGLVVGGVIFFLDFMAVPQVEVPPVEGLSLKEAEDVLTAKGLKYTIRNEVHNDQVPEGHVVVQEPAADRIVRQERVIELDLSLGPRYIEVPPLIGKTALEARLILEEHGFVPDIREEHSESVPRDHVIRQNPGEGFKLLKGNEVQIFVSLGGTPFRLRDFYGWKLDDARHWIESFGLELRYIDPQFSPQYPPGIVIDQFPESGSTVQAGDPVDLVITEGGGVEEHNEEEGEEDPGDEKEPGDEEEPA